MTYQIVKNKPLPSARGGGREVKYPFAKMKVGDAFEVSDVPANQKTRSSVSASARHYVKHHNPKAAFSTRLTDGSLWVWRVK